MASLRDRYLRRVAEKHDILVPSLVADKRVDDAEEVKGEEAGLLHSALGGTADDETPTTTTPIARDDDALVGTRS